jgi:hypothetical protein
MNRNTVIFNVLGVCAMLCAVLLAVSNTYDRCGWCDASHVSRGR